MNEGKGVYFHPETAALSHVADSQLDLSTGWIRISDDLAIMAHFNHSREVSTDIVREAIARIRETGAEIRAQSPLMRVINDSGEVWSDMWREQVRLGCIPHYMFVARDTGAQHFFSVPLVRAWEIFREANSRVSGLARTVRGPSMSADPDKVEVNSVVEVGGVKVISLRLLQGRNPEWTGWPFFAQCDSRAVWLDELRPAFGEERFFFEATGVEDAAKVELRGRILTSEQWSTVASGYPRHAHTGREDRVRERHR